MKNKKMENDVDTSKQIATIYKNNNNIFMGLKYISNKNDDNI